MVYSSVEWLVYPSYYSGDLAEVFTRAVVVKPMSAFGSLGSVVGKWSMIVGSGA